MTDSHSNNYEFRLMAHQHVQLGSVLFLGNIHPKMCPPVRPETSARALPRQMLQKIGTDDSTVEDSFTHISSS